MYSSGSFTTDGESFKKRSFLIAHRDLLRDSDRIFTDEAMGIREVRTVDRFRMWSASSDPSAGNA